MLILKELRFHGIGRFVEEQRISFESLGGLTQIDGQNNNTKGSSGAGKSTIAHALDFLLGLNSIPNTVLQSRLTSESIFVEGSFDCDEQPLIISRGKKLKIDLAGEVTIGSSKLSEEKLDQILTIPRHLLKPMLHKVQGEKGFFLSFTPKETNDFLTDCLGLGRFKKHLADLDIKLQELSKKKEILAISVESAKAGLSASKEVLASLGPLPAKEVDQETIVRLKDKAEASSAQLRAVLASQSKELTDFEYTRPVPTVIPFDASTRKQYENELQEIRAQSNQLVLLNKDKETMVQASIYTAQSKLSGLESMQEKGVTANEAVTQYVKEIKKIRSNICPKCEQTWTTESAKKEEAQLLENICKMRSIILTSEEAVAQIPSVKEEIERLRNDMPPAVPVGFVELRQKERETKVLIDEEIKKEYVHNDSVNTTNVGNQTIFSRKYNELKDKHSKDAEQLRGQASIDQRVFEAAIMKLRSYEEIRTRHESSIRTLKSQEKEHEEKLTTLSTEFSYAMTALEFTEELKKAVKSYLSCSFDEALESISENATRLVRNVPNMANATIQLVGFWETKEGRVKEEVNAILHLDGDENIDIRSLCGGERTAIDLAVDLSAIELIENKANKGINIFILDEPFNGLDTVCIEMALEVLKNASVHKKLVIVDHNPEVKQMVESKLLVIRDGTTSRVVQN